MECPFLNAIACIWEHFPAVLSVPAEEKQHNIWDDQSDKRSFRCKCD